MKNYRDKKKKKIKNNFNVFNQIIVFRNFLLLIGHDFCCKLLNLAKKKFFFFLITT